jgi:prepilin-type N-terminal cleavage/methylation domain-containing protein
MFDIIKQNYFKGRLKNNFNNNMNINNKKGFTLIELMVVIAIIGILVGIIIVSLNKSTDQAKDAKVRSAMGQLRSVAQIYYNNHEYKFSGLASDSEALAIKSEIEKNGGTGYELKDTTNAWCAVVDTPTGRCLCVDSTGAVEDGANKGTYQCDGDFKCAPK